MELAAALGLILIVALILLVGRLINERRATREELADIRHQHECLKEEVDRTSILAQNAAASAKRVEKSAGKASVVYVVPRVSGEPHDE